MPLPLDAFGRTVTKNPPVNVDSYSVSPSSISPAQFTVIFDVGTPLSVVYSAINANAPPGYVVQNGTNTKSTENHLTVDSGTSSTSFVTLLSVNITTGASFLIITSTFSTSNSAAGANVDGFRIALDGTELARSGTSQSIVSESGSITFQTAVSSGAHVIELQWRIGGGIGSIRCRPTISTVNEHASIVVQEVAA